MGAIKSAAELDTAILARLQTAAQYGALVWARMRVANPALTPTTLSAGDNANLGAFVRDEVVDMLTDGSIGTAASVARRAGRFAHAMSDANYTVLAADYQACSILEFAGSLTATRDVVLPLGDGSGDVPIYTVFNGTAGGQSIQFIGFLGLGVTVANGKRAVIYSDGNNYVRATPDV